MQLINYSSNEFEVAAERTGGIPEHATEIRGGLIEINKRNLMKWGIKSSAVDRILTAGVGLPVRICNNKDPHACDYAHDHSSDVGYVTKIWQDGDWIKASAIITDRAAAKKVNDGTWMRAGVGKWSVAGYPGPDVNNDGMLSDFAPVSISFVIPPNKPAYEGSNFELVAAAVKNNKLQSELNNKNQTGDNMTDGKENGANGDPKNEEEPGKANDIKPGDKTKVESKTEPEAKPAVEPNDKKDNPVMYNQDEYDKKLADSLATQKAEYDEQVGKMQQEMAQMTPNGDLESMLSAAKKETIEATLNEIKRDKLASDYVEMVAASTVLGAPFMEDGKLNKTKLNARGQEIKQLSASVIENMITDGKAMVAAMPAGNTAFDAADVPGKTIDADFNAKISKLGVTNVDFSRGA